MKKGFNALTSGAKDLGSKATSGASALGSKASTVASKVPLSPFGKDNSPKAVAARREAAQEKLDNLKKEKEEEAGAAPASSSKPSKDVGDNVLRGIEEQLQREKEQAQHRRTKSTDSQGSQGAVTTVSSAADLVTIYDPKDLSEEDRPGHTLFSAKSLMLKQTEAFAFTVDVNPGFFHVRVENAHASLAEALVKLGQEPTLYVRLKVVEPKAWAQPWTQDVKLGSHRNRKYDRVFSVNSSATVHVFVVHNGAVQAVGMKSHMTIHIQSCFTADYVNFHRGNGVKKSSDVQELWDDTETLFPDVLNPVPSELLTQIRCKHSFTATGFDENVIIFGGCNDDRSFSNQIFVVDTKNQKLGEFGDMFSTRPIQGGNRFVFTGVCPYSRAGHSACVLAGKVCFFGGFSNTETPLAETHFFHVESRAWSSPDGLRQTAIDKDPALSELPRGFHSAVVHDFCMWVYGGTTDFQGAITQTSDTFCSSSLWKYNFRDREWKDMSSLMKGSVPHNGGKVYGHSAVVADDGMYVFGGVSSKAPSSSIGPSFRGDAPTFTRNNDLYHMSFAQCVWTKIATTGVPPTPRAYSGMYLWNSQPNEAKGLWPIPVITAIPNKKEPTPAHLHAIFIYGGQTSSSTSDLFHCLPLKEFRGHRKFEWFSIDVDDSALTPVTEETLSDFLKDMDKKSGEKDSLSTGAAGLASLPKAMLYDIPRSGIGAATSSNKEATSKYKLQAIKSLKSLPKAALFDIPKAALFDLPKAALYDLPKAAIHSITDNDDDETPEYPGAYALVTNGDHIQLISFGTRPGGPLKSLSKTPSNDPPKEFPPVLSLPMVHPEDFTGKFNDKNPDDPEEDLEEDVISKAFTEFEQNVAKLKAHVQLVQRLSIEEPRKDFQAPFQDACQGLRKLIKKCNLQLLRFPHDAFGSKCEDVTLQFEVMQHQAGDLIAQAEREMEIHGSPEDEEPEEEQQPEHEPEPAAEENHESAEDITPTKEKEKSKFGFGKVTKFVPSVPKVPKVGGFFSKKNAKKEDDEAGKRESAGPAVVVHEEASPADTRQEETSPSVTVEPEVPPPPPAFPGAIPETKEPSNPAEPPPRPDDLPPELRHFADMVDTMISTTHSVTKYQSYVENGELSFLSALQEETEVLDAVIKQCQALCQDIPNHIYHSSVTRVQSEYAESRVRLFYPQVADAEVAVRNARACRLQHAPARQPSPPPARPTSSPSKAADAASSSGQSTSSETPQTASPTDGEHVRRPSTSSGHSGHSDHDEFGQVDSKEAEFRSRFSLPEDERLLNSFACAHKAGIVSLYQGRMYISKNNICFHSGMGGSDLTIPLASIANMTKKKTFMIENTIEIVTRQHKCYVFTNILKCTNCYNLLHSLWQSILFVADQGIKKN